MELGARIKKIRKQYKLTQNELAKKLGISTQMIVNYENGLRNISLEKLQQIANVFSLPVYLFFVDNFDDVTNFNRTSTTNNYDNPNTKKIPLISKVSAGHGTWGDEIIEKFIELPVNFFKKCDFATVVDGDSMLPEIANGEIVFVKQTNFLENGNIGIFNLNDEVFIKKYFKNVVTEEESLISLNDSYSPIIIKEEDNFKIIGRVVGSLNYSL